MSLCLPAISELSRDVDIENPAICSFPASSAVSRKRTLFTLSVLVTMKCQKVLEASLRSAEEEEVNMKEVSL